MVRNWDYFEAGSVVSAANLEVVRVLVRASAQRKTLYRVRCLHCGAEHDRDHFLLLDKLRRSSMFCACCRLENLRGKKPAGYGVTAPAWPRPPGVPAGLWVPLR